MVTRHYLGYICICMFRTSYWYLNIYVLWINTFINILIPIFSLVVLNIIILR